MGQVRCCLDNHKTGMVHFNPERYIDYFHELADTESR
jgi:hypothetical protein